MSGRHEPHLTHTCRLRVRYADTDKMGIVYYGKYFEYFEVARTEMLREHGLPYAEMEAQGYGLPVIDARAKYFRGATYDEELTIVVRSPAKATPRMHITYRITGENGDAVAEGETTLVFVDAKTGKPSRPPKSFADAMNAFAEQEKST